MPHSWSRLSDTRLREAFFAKHRSARPPQVPDKKDAKSKDGKGKDDRGKDVGKAALRAELREEMAQQANALVAHTQEGMSIVNLYNGAPRSTSAATV